MDIEWIARLLRQRGGQDDRERAAQLAVAVGKAVLTDLWGRDLRDALGHAGNKLYRVEELPDFFLSYATWALKQLQSLVGTTDPRYLEISAMAHFRISQRAAQ